MTAIPHLHEEGAAALGCAPLSAGLKGKVLVLLKLLLRSASSLHSSSAMRSINPTPGSGGSVRMLCAGVVFIS